MERYPHVNCSLFSFILPFMLSPLSFNRHSKYSVVCSETSLPLLAHTQHVAALLCSGVLWLGLCGRTGGGVSSITNNKCCLLLVMCNCGQTTALCIKKTTAHTLAAIILVYSLKQKKLLEIECLSGHQ